MNYEEENAKLRSQIRLLDVLIKQYEDEIEESRKPSTIEYDHNGLPVTKFRPFVNNFLLQDKIEKLKSQRYYLSHRLNQSRFSRMFSDFEDKTQVEHVSGRIYRGSLLGIILQYFWTIVVIGIIGLICCGIGSLFD